MRKFLSLLLLPLATMILSSHAYAADPDESLYDAAMAAIIDGGDYRIFTDVDGTKYYIAANGALTSAKDDACVFPFKKTTGGALYDEGIRIDVGYGGVFSNPPLNGDYANLNPGSFAIQRSLDRNDWERQVFFLDGDKYAIRTCNTAFDTWGWGDCGRTFWTYEIANVDPIPAYSYDAAFILVEDSITGHGYYQTNYYSANSQNYSGPFYGWEDKAYITTDVMFMDIARGCYPSFEGTPMLEGNMTSMQDYELDYTLPLPPTVLDKRQLHIVGIVIDRKTGFIQNGQNIWPEGEVPEGIELVSIDTKQPATDCLYDLFGRRINHAAKGQLFIRGKR